MKFFKKKDGSVSDAQAYLRSTDNVSRPTAILMSIVGFLAVFAIVFSLFLGGRWLYDTLTDDELGVKVTDSSDSSSSNSENEQNSGGLTVVDGGASRITGGATNATSSMADGNGVIDGNDSDAGKGVDDRDEVAAEPTVVAVVADELPDTGPADAVLILVAAVVLGALAHNTYTRTRA